MKTASIHCDYCGLRVDNPLEGSKRPFCNVHCRLAFQHERANDMQQRNSEMPLPDVAGRNTARVSVASNIRNSLARAEHKLHKLAQERMKVEAQREELKTILRVILSQEWSK